MNGHQPTPTDTPAATRPTPAEIEAWCREEEIAAAARFLGVLHDITFHHGEDMGPLLDLYGRDQALTVVLDLADQVTTATTEAQAQIKASAARRTWAATGAPLRCGQCGGDVDLGWDTWRVCGGWAEHENCHQNDPAVEEQNRRGTVEEAEYQAYLDHRNHHTGPQAGDRVRLTYPDGSTVEGTWELTDAGPVLRLNEDNVYDVAGHVASEVTELRDDEHDGDGVWVWLGSPQTGGPGC